MPMLNVRCSEEEWATLDAEVLASGKDRSTYVRAKLFPRSPYGGQPPVRPHPEPEPREPEPREEHRTRDHRQVSYGAPPNRRVEVTPNFKGVPIERPRGR